MKRFLSITSGLFFALSLTSCGSISGGLGGGSASYDVGYEVGASGQIGQMIFYGQTDNPTEACNLILEMSAAGTTNDGIDWASLDSNEYLSGCMEGQLDAHPDADWNQ